MNILRHIAIASIMACIVAATFFGARNHSTKGYTDVQKTNEVISSQVGEK